MWQATTETAKVNLAIEQAQEIQRHFSEIENRLRKKLVEVVATPGTNERQSSAEVVRLWEEARGHGWLERETKQDRERLRIARYILLGVREDESAARAALLECVFNNADLFAQAPDEHSRRAVVRRAMDYFVLQAPEHAKHLTPAHWERALALPVAQCRARSKGRPRAGEPRPWVTLVELVKAARFVFEGTPSELRKDWEMRAEKAGNRIPF